MGKIKNIFLFAAMLFGIQCLAQNYNIGYKIIFRPKQTDTASTTEHFNLRIDTQSKTSLFMSTDIVHSDFNHTIYKDFQQNSYKNYEMILYRVYESDYNFKPTWKLLPNTRTIAGYTCHEAEIAFGGRMWTAWYTADLPFQDGPFKFCGLPGLILGIYSKDKDYSFIVEKIEKTTDAVTELHATPFGGTEKEKKFKENTIMDPASQFRQQVNGNNFKVTATFNGKTSDGKAIARTIEDNFKSWSRAHDNPIEKSAIWIK